MQDALPAQAHDAPALEQQPAFPDGQENLFLRNDTIFGVCQGLGEEFGFNPIYLRLVFAGLFYFNPLWVIGTYLALGLAVAVARWLAPAERPVTAPRLAAQAEAPQAANEVKDDRERLAA